MRLTAGDQAFLSTFVGNRCSTENLKKRKKKTYFSISRVLPRKKNQTTNFGVLLQASRYTGMSAGVHFRHVCITCVYMHFLTSKIFTSQKGSGEVGPHKNLWLEFLCPALHNPER